MTTQKDFLTLIEKYQDGTCSSHERQLLEKWYSIKANHNPEVELHNDYWNDLWIRLRKILMSVSSKARKTITISWPLSILFVAAALVVVTGIWTVLFNNNTGLPADYANDVDPGGNKAVLTFQDGKTIQLSDAQTGVVIDDTQLSYNDGTVIDTEVPKIFSVSTPKGGTYKVQLPDGSKVWLNAATSLTYTPPLKEKGAPRKVKLIGEAYFEVSKDINHTFIVKTDQQEIEVLGTHFNVSAYSDELSSTTTLLEGSIKVAPLTTNRSKTKGLLLKPNQELTIDVDGVHVRKVDTDDAISWKNGEFTFTGEPLENIMQKIARWYNVEVVYADDKIGKKIFNGSISKFEKISQVLCLLEVTGEVHFKVEERRITVMQ